MSEQLGTVDLFAGQPLRPEQNQGTCCDNILAESKDIFIDQTGKCPIDEATGMPLPIAPYIDLNSLPDSDKNDHHHFYPRLSPVLRNTLGGRALRVARIQRVANSQHNFGPNQFHGFFPEGVDIPEDAASQLGWCALACAGFLSEKVVDTSSGEPITRPIKEWELRRLSRPSNYVPPMPYHVKRFRDKRYPSLNLFEAKNELINSRKRQAEMTYQNLIYGFDPMKNFILDSVINQDLTDVHRGLRSRFLDHQETEAGLCILAIGATLAAESALVNGRSLDLVYKEAFKDGRLHPLMPPRASTLLKHKLGHTADRVDMLGHLRIKLEQERELVA